MIHQFKTRISSPVYRTALFAAVIWSATIGGFLAWDVRVTQDHAEELAKHEARIRFNKDIAFRNWVAGHGGVYVPVSEKTPPNPGLAKINERDIETPSGKPLTLMNPAYVMRQVMAEYSELYGGKGKLTSLKVINPINQPDAWETAALLRFEQGEREISEFTEIDGLPYLRQIGALIVEKGCLKCHGSQGYKIGDVRGGIVISVAMRPYIESMERDIQRVIWPLGGIWLLGLGLIGMLALQIARRLMLQQQSEAALRKSREEISRAHTDLKRFADAAAHHLMEPVRRISSYNQLLQRGLAVHADAQADDGVMEPIEYINKSSTRLRALVRDIQLYLSANQSRGEVRYEDANLVLASVEQTLASKIMQRHAVIVAEALPIAKIDRQRFTDLFLILIDNALKHAQPADVGVPLEIYITGLRENGVSRYRISDNGGGVPAEYRERIFDIFETLQGAAENSTGIGLAIARRIVESCHGKIWMEGAAQGGASIVFELPDEELL